MKNLACLCLFVILLVPSVAEASVSRLARETAEEIFSRWGRKAAGDSLSSFSARLSVLARRHGDEVLDLSRRHGPEAVRAIERAGGASAAAVRLISKHGRKGVILASDPELLKLVAKYGDEAAAVLVRHPGVAAPLLRSHGFAAIETLARLEGRSARRLAILSHSGMLDRMGRTRELLTVIRRTGDAGMQFIWRHKGVLTVGTVLAAFLHNPEAFIDGTVSLAEVALDAASTAAAPAIAETEWALALPLIFLALGIAWRLQGKRRPSA